MPVRPLVAGLIFLGLFLVAIVVGYVAGQAFLSPTTTAPRAVRPQPPAETPPAPSVPLPAPQPLPQPSPEPAPPAPAPRPNPPAPARPPQAAPQTPGTVYRVQVGAFIRRENAEARAAELRERGFEAYINQAGGLFRVQVGAFAERENAVALAERLRGAGYEVIIMP